MAYREEKQVKLRRQGSKQAIALAMQGRWREAAAVNESLLENFPHDVDAHNRLGKAYMELGKYSRAKEVYTRTLEFDPYNVIAKKNLGRLSHLEAAVVDLEGKPHKAEPQHFIEEVGKARVVNLYRLATPDILAGVAAGDEVYLKRDGSHLVVENGRREQLGQVAPKYGQRLIELMEGGNKYTAAIVSSTGEAIFVIIREAYQDLSQAGRLSFPSRRLEGTQPYVSDRVFRRELEYEEEWGETLGYSIGGADTESFSEESHETGEGGEDNEE